ncbi:MAG: hypothetical protein AMXMBFR75_17350 [Candidatus Hinthialibacteria bacterium]
MMPPHNYQLPPIEAIPLPTVIPGSWPPLVERHLKWLHEYNQIHNLTRVPEEKWLERHVLDSLALHFALWRPTGRVLDLGTGGGFPGIPLAALNPDTPFVLLDSKQKVTRLLEDFIQSDPDSPNIQTLTARSEEAAHDPGHRGCYQTVVTRAVAALPVLIELALPFLTDGGQLICWKSDLSELSTSSKALAELRGSISALHKYHLPGEEKERYLIQITHQSPCPDHFPRKTGIPNKRPLVE